MANIRKIFRSKKQLVDYRFNRNKIYDAFLNFETCDLDGQNLAHIFFEPISETVFSKKMRCNGQRYVPKNRKVLCYTYIAFQGTSLACIKAFYQSHECRRHRIFVEQWSDSIYIALWRNDGFLHSFCIFSKSNASSENLITKFNLLKIFFRMSILSNSKTSWMFFNLQSRDNNSMHWLCGSVEKIPKKKTSI